MIEPLYTFANRTSNDQVFLIIGMIAGVLAVAAGLTLLVRAAAHRFGVVDVPGDERKIHREPIALLGGVAVISAVIIGLLGASPWLLGGYIETKHLAGICVAGFVLLLGGALDDKYNLRPHQQIGFPVLAAAVIIASGIGIEYITNPFGGVVRFDQWSFTVFSWNGLDYRVTVLSDLFTFVWLMVTMYTTKFLDGLDGLVSGISVIGLSVIAMLSFSAVVMQPETGTIALIGAAAFAGFLIFNWNPASIFLGESGSLFAGFFLGVLAILSGGKIATALLILGIPLLDVIWVVVRRFAIEGRSPFEADRKHLHLRLIDAGLSQKQAVFVLYVVTILFGASSLYLQSSQKVSALLVLGLIMLLFAAIVVRMVQMRQSSTRVTEGTKEVEGSEDRRHPQAGVSQVRNMIIVGCVVVGFVVIGISYQAVKISASKPDSVATVTINNASFVAEVADSAWEQQRGLMWREELPDGAGMLFVFEEPADRSFWMKNTLVPLDILWILDDEIVGITKDAQPAGNGDLVLYSAATASDTVLEVPAGSIAKYNLQIGDSVEISGVDRSQ